MCQYRRQKRECTIRENACVEDILMIEDTEHLKYVIDTVVNTGEIQWNVNGNKMNDNAQVYDLCDCLPISNIGDHQFITSKQISQNKDMTEESYSWTDRVRQNCESVPLKADSKTDEDYKFKKYEIPSFFSFQPLKDVKSSSEEDQKSVRSSDSEINYFSSIEEDFRFGSDASTTTVLRGKLKSKKLNKFTLPYLNRNDEKRIKRDLITEATVRSVVRHEMGQGDSPWIIVLVSKFSK